MHTEPLNLKCSKNNNNQRARFTSQRENKLPTVISLPSTGRLFVLARCSTFLPRDTNFEAIILVDLLDETNPGCETETGIPPQTKHKRRSDKTKQETLSVLGLASPRPSCWRSSTAASPPSGGSRLKWVSGGPGSRPLAGLARISSLWTLHIRTHQG